MNSTKTYKVYGVGKKASNQKISTDTDPLVLEGNPFDADSTHQRSVLRDVENIPHGFEDVHQEKKGGISKRKFKTEKIEGIEVCFTGNNCSHNLGFIFL